MRELVCVALDGSLEVWEGPGRLETWNVHLGDTSIKRRPGDGFFQDFLEIRDFCFERPPEFWGREVLSEL